jgi:hypothetical protein
MSFREWLNYVESSVESVVEMGSNFISPDDIWSEASNENKKPFIYLGNDVVSGGKLYTGGAYNTHIDLVGMHDDLQDRMNDLGYGSGWEYRVKGIDHDLMGRMGDWAIKRDDSNWANVYRDNSIDDSMKIKFLLVSFWNKEKPLYDHNLVDCLRSLEEYFEGKDVFVATPLLGTVHISKVMGGAVGVAMSDSDREKLELHQRLHLMNPVEKKAAMEKLGLGGVKMSKKWDWEAGMRGLGMPGYMRQSEWSYL